MSALERVLDTDVDMQYTPVLRRSVVLRPHSSDRQVWSDTFTGLYHVPPADMPEPSTVLDLGANIGLTAAHYAALWPHADIVAVEMDADNVAAGKQNAPSARWRCHALAARAGWGWYDSTLPSEAYSFHTLATKGTRVPSLTMRQVITSCFSTGSVDFVKMDIEGAEWKVFELGTWATLVRYLLVELHGEDESDLLIDFAIAALEQLGFQARPHDPHPQAVWAWR